MQADVEGVNQLERSTLMKCSQSLSRGKLSCIWSETLYHRDDALLYIAYVMLIWTANIPADRWHCNLRP